MLRPLLLLIVAVSLAGAVRAEPTAPSQAPSQKPLPAAPNSKPDQMTITPEEWQELRAARSAALQANPDLISQNKKLLDKMRDFEDKVDAAMVKADPNIAPIIAKFEAGRRRSAVATTSPSVTPSTGK